MRHQKVQVGFPYARGQSSESNSSGGSESSAGSFCSSSRYCRTDRQTDSERWASAAAPPSDHLRLFVFEVDLLFVGFPTRVSARYVGRVVLKQYAHIDGCNHLDQIGMSRVSGLVDEGEL